MVSLAILSLIILWVLLVWSMLDSDDQRGRQDLGPPESGHSLGLSRPCLSDSEAHMTSTNITLICPTRGNIGQSITPGASTLASVGAAVGGVFSDAASQWYKHENGQRVPVNSNAVAEVGATYSAATNVKAGR